MSKVSIVLPTYNGEKYLKQSIDSIFTQVFTDWELIIVDDCSTDRTGSIADEYAKMDSRIQVIHNTVNQKLPRSLNIGFGVAKGEYLTWTSDDNLYMPNALAVMAEELDRNEKAYMVRASMYYIDDKGKITGQSEVYNDEKLYMFNCLGACFMYRREVYELIGGYDEDTFCVEDYDYWLRIVGKFGGIVPIDQILYRYRRHEGSLSEQRRKQVNDQLTKLRIRYLDKIFEVLYGNQKELCRIYYNMKVSEYMPQDVVERFKRLIPELYGEIPYTEHQKYILFGAGKYGEKAAYLLGSQAVFFADNNSDKTGARKCGLEIRSFSDAVKYAEDYAFMITVAGESVYEMIRQLQMSGIKQYVVFVGENWPED